MQLILAILTHFSIDSEGFYSLFQVTEHPACLLEGQFFEKLLGSASTYMATRSVCFSTFCSCSEIFQEPTRWRIKNRSLPYSLEDNQSRSVWNLLFCSDLHTLGMSWLMQKRGEKAILLAFLEQSSKSDSFLRNCRQNKPLW